MCPDLARQSHRGGKVGTSPGGRRWLGFEKRCVVPFTSFSEFNKEAGGDIWFAFNESRPLNLFAGKEDGNLAEQV
jgi:putative SOS response-associated peptidase YedK